MESSSSTKTFVFTKLDNILNSPSPEEKDKALEYVWDNIIKDTSEKLETT